MKMVTFHSFVVCLPGRVFTSYFGRPFPGKTTYIYIYIYMFRCPGTGVPRYPHHPFLDGDFPVSTTHFWIPPWLDTSIYDAYSRVKGSHQQKIGTVRGRSQLFLAKSRSVGEFMYHFLDTTRTDSNLVHPWTGNLCGIDSSESKGYDTEFWGYLSLSQFKGYIEI